MLESQRSGRGFVALAALVVITVPLAGCFTRTVRSEVYLKDSVRAVLRHRSQGGAVVARGFQHPTQISSQRVSHILGAIDIETSGGKGSSAKQRRVAIRPELLGPISKAVSSGLTQANEDQEVAITSVRKELRLGIFHRKYLTTLVTYVRKERLYIHFSRIDWEIPKDRKNDQLPEPIIGEKQMPFRTIAGRRMAPAGTQGVAVRWHDNLFSSPVRKVRKAGGATQQRTILMESPIPLEELEAEAEGAGLDRLDPQLLRGLADLEEARRAGRMTESEYRERREELLGESGG
jgi:hypothetical protein